MPVQASWLDCLGNVHENGAVGRLGRFVLSETIPYFFSEADEERSGLGIGWRVVRIGPAV